MFYSSLCKESGAFSFAGKSITSKFDLLAKKAIDKLASNKSMLYVKFDITTLVLEKDQLFSPSVIRRIDKQIDDKHNKIEMACRRIEAVERGESSGNE